jgi:hypothetical protein
MPALVSQVILNEESQAHRRIFADHALNAELLLREAVEHCRQNLVFGLPPIGQDGK